MENFEGNNNLSRFQLSAGSLTLDYQGNEDFIRDDLVRVVQEILEALPDDVLAAPVTLDKGVQNISPVKDLQHMSTNTIAGLTAAKSGPDLVLAAIAHLQLVKGQPKAQRSEILNVMKGATTYYKSTYGSNLSSYLNSLAKSQKVNLIADSTYALTASEVSNFEALLAKN